MKKILFFLITVLLISGIVNAQVATYNFSQSVGTFTPITGGTLIADAGGANSLDQYVSPQITIPDFYFGGSIYNTAFISSNGFITLGGVAPSTSVYTAISTTTGSGITISAFGADLYAVTVAASTELRMEVIGNETIFQWKQFRRYLQTENFDMQIRLNNINGQINIVYRLNTGPSSSTSYQPQVGIRTSTTDYSNRLVNTTNNWATSLNGTANTSTARFTSTAPATNFTTGQTFTWTPPVCSTPNPGNTISSANGLCLGQSITLSTENSSTGAIISYQWQSSTNGTTWNNIAGATHSTYTTTPTAEIFYRVAVTCSQGPVTVNSNPIQIYFTHSIITTTNGGRCGTGTVQLAATGDAGTTINWYTAATGGSPIGTGSTFTTPSISTTTTFYAASEATSIGTVQIGNGTLLTDAATNGVTAFCNRWSNYRHQYIYTAAELQASGLSAGNITSMGYNITTLGDAATNANFTVKIGNTTLNSFTTAPYQTTPMNTVYGPATYTHTATGVQNIVFSTPYNWDGISNIIVDVAYSGANALYSSQTYYTATAQNMGTQSYNANSPNLTTIRLNTYFSGNTICSSVRTPVTANVSFADPITTTADQTVCNGTINQLSVTSTLATYDSYVWSPTANLYTDAAATIPYTGGSATTVYQKSTTAGTVAYTVTGNNSVTLCGNTATVNVTTQPASVTLSATSNNICISGTSTLSLNPASGYGAGNVQWQSSTDNITFTDIAGATAETYTTPVITSTTYYKAVIKNSSGAICTTSPSITVNVYNPQITSTTPGTRCGAGTVALGANASAGSTINWYSAATGGTVLGTGTSFTTPSISTTTTFYVEAVSPAASLSGTVGATYTGTSNNLTSVGSHGILITANSALTITSAKIPFTGTGNITVSLRSSTGTLINSYTATNVTGSGTTPVVVPLNIPVAAAGSYQLIVTAITGTVNNLGYSTGTYPYTDPLGMLSVTSGYWYGTDASNMYLFNLTYSVPCSSTRTAVVATVTPAPAITPIATPATICQGQSSTLSVTSSNAGYTYTWMPGSLTGNSVSVSPTATTTYTVNATDNSGGANNGCFVSGTTTVTVNPLPSPLTVTPTAALYCAGSPAIAISTTGGTVNTVILNENFNAATNSWTKINNTTGGTPANAAWTLRPDGYAYGSTTFNSNDNSQFYLSNSDAAGSGSSVATILQSPSFSTIGFSTATLSFYQYYRNLGTAVVEASTNGTTWANILPSPTATIGTATAFALTTVNLPAAYLNQPTVYIRFKYDGGWVWYWAIDNVLIAGQGTANTTWSPAAGLFTNAAGTTPYVAGTSATTVYAAPTTTTTYTATATSSAGCSVTATSTITANNPVAYTAQPANVTNCEGLSATFNATVTGSATITYQWQVSTNGGTTWTNIPGATAATYTVTPLTNALNNNQYRLVATNACGSVNSSAATLIVTPQPNATISYAQLCQSSTSVAPTIGGTAGTTGGTFSSTTGLTINATTGVINPSTSTAGNYVVTYTVAAAGGCSVYTTTANVSVLIPAIITVQPASQSKCEGDQVTFSVTATNATSYQWQELVGTTWTNISGATSATYSFVSSQTQNGKQFRVVVGGQCGPVNSSVATFTMYQTAVLNLSAGNYTIMPGETITMTATANPAGGTYQWYLNGNPLGGPTTNNVLKPITSDGIGTYHVVYTTTNGCPTTSSNVVIGPKQSNQLFVYPNPNNGNFQIRYYGNAGDKTVAAVYNSLGQIVLKKEMTIAGPYGQMEVNLGGVANGMYILKLYDAKNVQLDVTKIIVNR